MIYWLPDISQSGISYTPAWSGCIIRHHILSINYIALRLSITDKWLWKMNIGNYEKSYSRFLVLIIFAVFLLIPWVSARKAIAAGYDDQAVSLAREVTDLRGQIRLWISWTVFFSQGSRQELLDIAKLADALRQEFAQGEEPLCKSEKILWRFERCSHIPARSLSDTDFQLRKSDLACQFVWYAWGPGSQAERQNWQVWGFCLWKQSRRRKMPVLQRRNSGNLVTFNCQVTSSQFSSANYIKNLDWTGAMVIAPACLAQRPLLRIKPF